MEEWLKEIGKEVPKDSEEAKELVQMREAWEKMLIAGMNGADVDENDPASLFSSGGLSNPLAPATASGTKSVPVAEPSAPRQSPSSPYATKANSDFQSTIRQAMEKLKNSESNLKVSAIFSISCDQHLGLLPSLALTFPSEFCG
jgi:hypothetical protein